MSRVTKLLLAWASAVGLAVLLWAATTATVTCVISKTSKTPMELKAIEFGIKGYEMEYRRFPLLPDAKNALTDQRFESTGKLLACLLGRNVDGLNPREIAFIDPPAANCGVHGLIEGTHSGDVRLVDYWGHPYIIVMDTNGDGKIDNPDVKNASPLVNRGAPAVLATDVLVFSRGTDGIEGTRDDVVSWRP